MKKFLPFIIATLVVVGIVVVVVVLGKNTNNSNPETKPQIWAKGNTQSPVVLTEFSDFQCPACASWWVEIEQLVSEYNAKIKFEYRHFPLNYHKNAIPAAKAAEAAGYQNQFWQMANLLFTNQNEWAEINNFEEQAQNYAKQLGLDAEQFKKDYQSSAVLKKVKFDRADGVSLNLEGTPSFLINGELIKLENSNQDENYQPVLELKKLLDEAIDSSQRVQ